MARGGRRHGAGRPIGAVAKAKQQAVKAAVAGGETPLDYMLRVMRNKKADQRRRDAMAVAAAPYVHPRLQSAIVKGEGEDGQIIVEVVKFAAAG